MALVRVSVQQPRLVVPGHGNFGGTEIADNVPGYFGEIRRMMASSEANKAISAEAVRRLEPMVQRMHPTWERTMYIAPALRYLSELA